jgi:hypothetical protein
MGGRYRCRATDKPEWGANAIFTLTDRKLRQASYYKLPAPQTEQENCVAHHGLLIPVPGRDIKVQAWYQGGVSVFDFTDPMKPVEIAFFDRAPVSATELVLSGYWSAYWYNGHIYGSEIGRGLNVFRLMPSEHLTEAEIDAANRVRFDRFNPQDQQRLVWPANFQIARVYLDQLVRYDGFASANAAHITAELRRAGRLPAGARRSAALGPAAAYGDCARAGRHVALITTCRVQ